MVSDLHFMQPTNNDGSIIIRFSKFEYKCSLAKLGLSDSHKCLNKAIEICAIIENDMKLGRFTAKNNDELYRDYPPNLEDTYAIFDKV